MTQYYTNLKTIYQLPIFISTFSAELRKCCFLLNLIPKRFAIYDEIMCCILKPATRGAIEPICVKVVIFNLKLFS